MKRISIKRKEDMDNNHNIVYRQNNRFLSRKSVNYYYYDYMFEIFTSSKHRCFYGKQSWFILSSTSLISGLSWGHGWCSHVIMGTCRELYTACHSASRETWNFQVGIGTGSPHTPIAMPKLYTSIFAVCLLWSSVFTSGAAYTAAPSVGVVARWLRLADPK